MMMLISSFRAYYIGADYIRYVPIFQRIQIVGLEHPYEKGYVLLNLLAGKISENYWSLGLCVNLLIFSSLYVYIKKNISEKYYYFILLVFYLNPYMYIQTSFNVLRQGCATAFILIAVQALNEKKWAKYFILVLVSAQFHSLGYIFLLLSLTKIIKWRKSYFYIILGVSTFINVVLSNLEFMRKIFSYFDFDGYTTYGTTMFDFKIFTLFIVVVVCLLIHNYNDLTKRDEKKQYFINVYLLSLCLLPIFVKNDMTYRIYIIFSFISLPAISYILDTFYRIGNKILYNTFKWGYMMYYFALWSAFLISQRENFAYIPFVFYWQ